MIRRDYILREIEKLTAILARITGLTQKSEWQEASAAIEPEFQRLSGLNAEEIARLSETELLARLMRGEPTFVVENKVLMLTAMLKAHGDILAGQQKVEESRQFYLKGLNLLLDGFGRGEVTERPDFVPAVESFLTGLGDAPLPVKTSAMLMQHYERTGEFAKAEDALFAILDIEPTGVDLLEFGFAFYQRLLVRRTANSLRAIYRAWKQKQDWPNSNPEKYKVLLTAGREWLGLFGAR